MMLRTGARPYFLYNFPKGKVFEGDGLIRLIEEILNAMRELVEKEE